MKESAVTWNLSQLYSDIYGPLLEEIVTQVEKELKTVSPEYRAPK